MLDVLFHPKSIAVIGVSRTAGKVGFEVLSNLTANGFEGQIIPINPAADEILGHKCYPALAAYDRPVDLTLIAVPSASVLEAVEIAERIGFPVAMKVVSTQIVHKSDVASAEDVRDTFDLLTLRVGRRAPHVHLDGMYVEKMCGHGLQVILGVTGDPKFGPLLVFGLGGTFVDRLKGLCCHLAPVTAEEAMQMLAETRSYALLQSALDRENIDVSAIISGLQRISQLATDFPQVKELSIDPYLVGPVGTEAMVVDARMTLFTNGNEK